METDWRAMTLREAGVTLIDCVHRTPPAAAHGYPYIAIPQMKDGHLDVRDARRISREHYLEWTVKATPRAGDIVLSRRCNPGETAVVPPGLQCALGQNLVLLRSDGDQVIPAYLRWLVRSPAWWEQVNMFINVGAVFDSLRCADVPKFSLPFPSLPLQERIADILGSLDDKIELNRQMNETLEAMARALFKSWFVDFDPVRAKQEGRAPYGMDAETAALFPDAFEDSELGPIPKGWRWVPLQERATIRGGKQLVRDEYSDSGTIPVFGANGQMGWTHEPTHEGFVVAFGRVGAYCGSIHWSQRGAWINNNATAVVPCPASEMHVLHSMLATEWSQFRRGSAQPFIPNSAVQNLPILAPPDEVVRSFEEAVRPLRSRQAANNEESVTLAELRDTLLPKLISGELRIPDGEAQAEAAL